MQPVYKQQARGWQIAKQLSGLNPLSGLKPKISKFNCLKSNIGKILKSLTIILILNPESYCIPHRHRLLGQTTK